MNQEIIEAIQDIDEEINILNSQKELLKHLDLSKPMNESEWHEICETGLRYSDILCNIVKNIFKDAENIVRGCNYVYFEIKGFKIEIPTSRTRGINVDTSWYHYKEKPNRIMNGEYSLVYDMKQYFELKENGGSWYEKAKYKIHNRRYGYKKWVLAILWFGKYKWTNDNEEFWKERIEKVEKEYCERVEKVEKENEKVQEKRQIFLEEIIPEIERFSTIHYGYQDKEISTYSQTSIENIIKDSKRKEICGEI